MYRASLILYFMFLIGASLLVCSSAIASDNLPDQQLKRHVLTLKDFWDDPDLTADPRNLVIVASRQTPSWVSLPEARGDNPMAVIPYYFNRKVVLGFRWGDSADDNNDYAVLKNEAGIPMLILESGDSKIQVIIPPGKYSLEIHIEDKKDHKAVYIQPLPDVEESLFNPSTVPYPEQLVFHIRDCPECNLSGGNLFQAEMTGGSFIRSDLSGANLFQADLAGASLPEAKLDGSNVYQANFIGADLTGTVMTGANIFQSNFTGAVLSDADMTGVNAPEACFVGAQLNRTLILGAVLGHINAVGANFTNARLNGAILFYADLTNADFCGTDLREADLTGANVDGANFSGADMTDAVWINGRPCTGGSIDTCK